VPACAGEPEGGRGEGTPWLCTEVGAGALPCLAGPSLGGAENASPGDAANTDARGTPSDGDGRAHEKKELNLSPVEPKGDERQAEITAVAAAVILEGADAAAVATIDAAEAAAAALADTSPAAGVRVEFVGQVPVTVRSTTCVPDPGNFAAWAGLVSGESGPPWASLLLGRGLLGGEEEKLEQGLAK